MTAEASHSFALNDFLNRQQSGAYVSLKCPKKIPFATPAAAAAGKEKPWRRRLLPEAWRGKARKRASCSEWGNKRLLRYQLPHCAFRVRNSAAAEAKFYNDDCSCNNVEEKEEERSMWDIRNSTAAAIFTLDNKRKRRRRRRKRQTSHIAAVGQGSAFSVRKFGPIRRHWKGSIVP